MKKILQKVLLFLLLLIAADQLTGWYLGRLYERNDCLHSGGELNAYLKNKPADIVFVGSSRVNTMINPEVVSPKAINVSEPAKHFFYHLSVVDLMDQYGKMPTKMLVMNLEVEDVYEENGKRLVDDVFYLKYYYDKNKLVTEIIRSKGISERFKFLFSTYRFNGENFRLLTNPLQGICKHSNKGYMSLEKGANDSLRLSKGVEDMKHLKLTVFNPDFFRKLDHLVLLCKKNNVKLVLLYGPNFYFPESFKKSAVYLAQYCSRKKITFLNFSMNQDPVFDQRALWYDHIHLNSEGSVIYSEMVKTALEKLY